MKNEYGQILNTVLKIPVIINQRINDKLLESYENIITYAEERRFPISFNDLEEHFNESFSILIIEFHKEIWQKIVTMQHNIGYILEAEDDLNEELPKIEEWIFKEIRSGFNAAFEEGLKSFKEQFIDRCIKGKYSEEIGFSIFEGLEYEMKEEMLHEIKKAMDSVTWECLEIYNKVENNSKTEDNSSEFTEENETTINSSEYELGTQYEMPTDMIIAHDEYVVAVDKRGQYYIYIGGVGVDHNQRNKILDELSSKHPEIFSNGDPIIENGVIGFNIKGKEIILREKNEDIAQNYEDSHRRLQPLPTMAPHIPEEIIRLIEGLDEEQKKYVINYIEEETDENKNQNFKKR